jgi:hypothetical protein
MSGDTARVVTPFSPSAGAAVIFSSGWENMHGGGHFDSEARRVSARSIGELTASCAFLTAER